jgi:peptidoglycan hydrolase-like protein with peptidoglycan-binding domain
VCAGGGSTAAAEAPSCTADAIGADTGLLLRPEVICSAGFAMGMLAPSANGGAASSCTSIDSCAYPQVFHVTTSGWVHDGVHARVCAEQIGVYFMSPQTAATFAPVCNTATWPAPEVVQEGATGAAVMYVQIALVNAGYAESVDGSFGSGTTAAVRSFQSTHGLEATGVVGPETHALLGTGPNPPPLTPGEPPACDAATISADTGLAVTAVRGCVAGWAQGLLSTTCTSTEPGVECEDADVFHVTEQGWAYDGTMYAYCAEHLADRTGMSIYTAVELTPACAEIVLPPRSNILPGGRGEQVMQLQIALVAAGYPIAVDGTYGPRTEAAVRDFQQRHGLEVDGIAGPQTRTALSI